MTSEKAFLRIAKEFFNRSGFSYLRSADRYRQGTILDTSGTYTYMCTYILIYVCVGIEYLRLLEVTLKGRGREKEKEREGERKEREGPVFLVLVCLNLASFACSSCKVYVQEDTYVLKRRLRPLIVTKKIIPM